MKIFNLLAVKVLFIAAVFTLASCTDTTVFSANAALKDDSETLSEQPSVDLVIHKSRTCSCCQEWMNHMEDSGFKTTVSDITYLSELKEKKGIAPNYRSCHTAESKDGYVFEGHVPAKYIKQYLDNAPEGTIGLAVPAMPVGTPGMEMGDRFMPYQILLLNTDGTSSIYAEVASYDEQF